MSGEITQGSVIYGIRSSKYPNTRCFGIVISARCDIANCKVSKFYYLVAVDIKDWLISDIGFPPAYLEKTENVLRELHNKHKLNHSCMITFSNEEVDAVTTTHISKERDRKDYLKAYQKFKRFSSPEFDCAARREIIHADNKVAMICLKEVSKGDVIHFCLIPQTAYVRNGIGTRGVIVDLQEIEILPMDDAIMIQSGGIDLKFQTFNDEEKSALNLRYFLNSDDDFVCIEGHIGSPWIEYLMQRFSNSFARVGVDGVSDTDCNKIISAI